MMKIKHKRFDITIGILLLILAPACVFFEDRGNIYDPKSDNFVGLVTDKGNGTVYVSATGLYWKKCSQGQSDLTCSGTALEYMYCNTYDNSCNGGVNFGILDGNGDSAVWDSCNELNNTFFAGFTSWRAPIFSELNHFYDNAYSENTDLFPNTMMSHYWSSSGYEDNLNYAYGINFSNGNIGYYNKTYADYVRCVAGP